MRFASSFEWLYLFKYFVETSLDYVVLGLVRNTPQLVGHKYPYLGLWSVHLHPAGPPGVLGRGYGGAGQLRNLDRRPGGDDELMRLCFEHSAYNSEAGLKLMGSFGSHAGEQPRGG